MLASPLFLYSNILNQKNKTIAMVYNQYVYNVGICRWEDYYAKGFNASKDF